MTNDTRGGIPEDYQFNEEDLLVKHHRDTVDNGEADILRAEPSDSVVGSGEPSIREPIPDDTSANAHDDNDDDNTLLPEQVDKVSFLSKHGLPLAGGGAVLILLCGLGWLASQVLSPTSPTAERVSSPDTFSGTKKVIQIERDDLATEPLQFGDDLVKVAEAQEPFDHANLVAAKVDSVAAPVLPVTPRNEQEQDEKFYDTLVEASERNIEIPPAKSTTPPVEVSADTGAKFAAISIAIANSGKEMTTVLEAIKNLSGEITTLKAQIDASTNKTNLVDGKLNQLTVSINELSKNTEAKFNEISKSAVNAALQAVKRENTKNAQNNGKLVLVGGAIKSDYPAVKTPIKRTDTPKPQKQELVAAQKTVAAPVKTQSKDNAGNQAVKCGAQTVSQVWKVKGVTFTGAYVRRDDGSALMLREDMLVPGFGKVKSFDPSSRTVCTTSGLIAR